MHGTRLKVFHYYIAPCNNVVDALERWSVVSTSTEGSALLVPLAEVTGLGPSRAGGKAYNLGCLAAAGLRVPPGVVVLTPEAAAAVPRAVAGLEGPFAVRSSGAAEDLAGASFAGQYETVLEVSREDLPEAVQRVFASAGARRVAAYRAALANEAEPAAGMAVLVQSMVAADAAGVAFTADPMTGNRDVAVVTAVRGLAEALVGGEAVGDEWVVRGEHAGRRRRTEGVIGADEALAVAAMARRAEAIFGTPQDVEWAIAGGELFMLQARPMTALPEAAAWVPPCRGWWLRNFRLGEWLPEPVTPLFAAWLLPALGRGVSKALAGESGLSLALDDAVVNGWYYTTPQPRAVGRPLGRQLLRHPGAVFELPAILLLLLRPDWVTGALVRMSTHWRQVLLPAYRRAVDQAETEAGNAPPAALVGVVDRVAEVAGEYFWSVATLAGSQWKLEAVLARFVRAHIPGIEESAQVLVTGLPGMQADLPAHAVHSIDWYWPTAAELGHVASADRHRELAARREAMQARCRAALAGNRRARRFDRLLELAQHYAVVREQQTRLFTLGWPVLRRCALRLGAYLADRGLIGRSDDVFFLTRDELDAALADQRAEPLPAVAAERRTEWERQRRLVAPLEIGAAPWLARMAVARAVDAARTGSAGAEGAIVGQPASPGRATGPVRVITDPAGFDRFATGEVLVARATAPAWTPLFGKAVAVVTDGGTLAAHASLVAREYGIPAVVATGDATTQLHDGQVVTVDGGAGVVEVQ
jgi:phosphohistidine swiveling domain-containing protein